MKSQVYCMLHEFCNSPENQMYSLSVFVSYNSTKALAVESIEKYVVLGHVASVFLWTNMKKLRNRENRPDRSRDAQ